MKKSSIFRIFGLLVVALIGFLGFSCNKNEEENDYPVEYGTPSARYIVRGNVSSAEDRSPLSGIRISNVNYEGAPDFRYVETDNLGDFRITTTTVGRRDTLWLEITDPAEIHQTDTVHLLFRNVPFIGAERWFDGEAQYPDKVLIELDKTQPELPKE